MENESPKISISELFHPLGERLYDLETQTEHIELDMDNTIATPSIQRLMEGISRNVDAYEDSEVVVKCNSYLQRIDALKKNLKVADHYHLTQYEFEYLEEYITTIVKRSPDEMDTALLKAKEGLEYCKTHLTRIKENHSFSPSTDAPAPKTIVTEIKLPDNFTVKQLTAHIDPLLSLRQATLFLYYLRKNGVIPYYNSSELGRLGEIFFARNNKNIREELTDIHENRRNTEDLKAFEQMLKSILKEVSGDLEKAK